MQTYTVSKRFNDFESLYNKLLANYPEYLIPPLPAKSVRNLLAADDSDFVKERVKDLEYFIVRLSLHPRLSMTPEFKEFLTEERHKE